MKLFSKKSGAAVDGAEDAAPPKSKADAARFEPQISARKINVLNETKTNICTSLNLWLSLVLLVSVGFNVYFMLRKHGFAPVFSQIPKGTMYQADVRALPLLERAPASAPPAASGATSPAAEAPIPDQPASR